jgi:hypothetical protein
MKDGYQNSQTRFLPSGVLIAVCAPTNQKRKSQENELLERSGKGDGMRLQNNESTHLSPNRL